MASKKDLVEAHAFSRRRLVTAFVSGAPGGREVEPSRPGRTIIGGVALTVLLLAGAAIAGFFSGRPDAGWLEQGSFIISRDTGEQYVVMTGEPDPVLQRVPNYISAQLLLGKADLSPYTVKDRYIRDETLGPDLGIEGAPAGLPDTGGLINSGWVACTAEDAGIKLTVARDPEVSPVSDGAYVVRTPGERGAWLIASSRDDDQGRDGRAYRYRIDADDTQLSTLLDRLGTGFTIDSIPVVDPQWLNLFGEGADLSLDAFGVDGSGPAPYQGLTEFRVGDLVQNDTGSYLLGDDQVQRLAEFPALLYQVLNNADARSLDRDIASQFGDPEHPEDWPVTTPEPVGASQLCVQLEAEAGEAPRAVVVSQPGAEESAEGLPPGGHDVDIEPSGGSFVLVGSDVSESGGTPYVVDAKGSSYALVGPLVPGFIGYGDASPPSVPDAWMEFFTPGVPLSTNLARRLPEDAPDETS